MKKFIILLIGIVFISCGRQEEKVNIRGIDLDIEIERFDRQLFEMDQDTLQEGISWFYSTYEDFFDIFSYYVIGIGSPSERDFQGYLTMFLNDELNREVYERTQEVFPDLEDVEAKMTEAFKYYKYYLPEALIPDVIAYISRFNNPYFTVSHYLGIGLDRYLDNNSEYYLQMGIPEYQRRNMIPEKIPSDACYAWVKGEIPFNDSLNTVLSNIIHEGKLMYLTERMLPDEPDSLIFGFTEDQMRWCEKNEEEMWVYLVENKLLFSMDPMDIRKLVSLAPFSSFFTTESPGRAAVWVGWRIVQEYARRNPEVSMADIMAEMDYESILRRSRYNP